MIPLPIQNAELNDLPIFPVDSHTLDFFSPFPMEIWLKYGQIFDQMQNKKLGI